MSVFGFSTEPASGDFLPIIKYDARAGRVFRIDRSQTGQTPVDITDAFCAIFDLENVETGWMNFSGSVPDFKLVPLNPNGETTLPVRPSENHKNGIRLLLKLHPACAGADKPIREFSTSAKAALSGLQKLYLDYQQARAAQGNKLPIVGMRGAVPVKTGTGERQSTNYVPQFVIIGWADRPSDLVYIARGSSGPSQNALPLTQPQQQYAPRPNPPNGNAGPSWPTPQQPAAAPPMTGSTQVGAPAFAGGGWPSVPQPAAPSLSDDFG